MESGAIRLVLKEADPRKAIGTLAYGQEWQLKRMVDATDDTPREVIYGIEDDDTRIHYTEDHNINLAYVTVVGSKAAQTAELIRRHLNVFSVEGILREAQQAKSRDDWIYVVYQLGPAAPAQPDARVVKVFEQALANDDADVRRAAIVGLTYTEWQAFRPILERVAAADPDPEVREFARITVDGLGKLQKPFGF